MLEDLQDGGEERDEGDYECGEAEDVLIDVVEDHCEAEVEAGKQEEEDKERGGSCLEEAAGD